MRVYFMDLKGELAIVEVETNDAAAAIAAVKAELPTRGAVLARVK